METIYPFSERNLNVSGPIDLKASILLSAIVSRSELILSGHNGPNKDKKSLCGVPARGILYLFIY